MEKRSYVLFIFVFQCIFILAGLYQETGSNRTYARIEHTQKLLHGESRDEYFLGFGEGKGND